MQTTYYNDQIAVQLDRKSIVKRVILNTYDNVLITPEQSIIHIISDINHNTFYEQFSKTLNNEISLGSRMTLKNGNTVFLFMLKNFDGIILFTVGMEEEIVTLFDDLIKINNEQVRSIRELYQKLSKKDEESSFLEEIMLVNNALINTRRELSIKNKQLITLNNELQNINFTDYLTQTPNRRRFFYDVYRLVAKQDYLLVMMDFNNFKTINDNFGHNVGDELLCVFTQRMTKMLSNFNATLYRLGGDEFACLAPANIDIPIEEIMLQMEAVLHEYHKDIGMAWGALILTKENCNKQNKVEFHMNKADKKMYHMKEEFYKAKDIKRGGKRHEK